MESRAVKVFDLAGTALGFLAFRINVALGVLTLLAVIGVTLRRLVTAPIRQRDAARAERDRLQLWQSPTGAHTQARWLFLRYIREGKKLRRRLARNRSRNRVGALVGAVQDWDWRFRNAFYPLHKTGWATNPYFGDLFSNLGITSVPGTLEWLDNRLDTMAVMERTGK